MPDYLFVYGTLLSQLEHRMHELLVDQADFIGPARVTGKLYDLGAYPGLVNTPESDSRVWGELYRLRDPHPTLARLDVYEGCPLSNTRAAEYARRHVIARRPGGARLRCWVYVFRGPVRGQTLIRSGDYLRYLGLGSSSRCP